jgi:phage baseplate assembly protein W
VEAAGDSAFLGHGWRFPLEAAEDGELALSDYDRDVHEAVRIVLGTDPGERVMRPDFGAGLRGLLFEPLTATTASLVRHRVEQALVLWEPRIDVLDIRTRIESGARSALVVEVEYRVRATNTFYNLVYPFYLLEGEEGSA